MWVSAELISMALDSTSGNTLIWLSKKYEKEKRVTIQTQNSEGIMPGMSNSNIEIVVKLINSLSGKISNCRVFFDDKEKFKGEVIIFDGNSEFKIDCSAPFAASIALRFNSDIIVPESIFEESDQSNEISSDSLKKHLNCLSATEMADYYF